MSDRWFHRPLASPRLYDGVQKLLGAGDRTLEGVYSRGFGASEGCVLDVGCGPTQETPLPRGTLIGIDINANYVARYSASDNTETTRILGAVGSAAALPFADASCDETRCVAVLHHLPDELATATVKEMHRVTRPGGRIVIWEMLLPDRWSDGPLATLLCRLDRGRYVRPVADVRALLGHAVDETWEEERFRYAWPRLHGGQWIAIKS